MSKKVPNTEGKNEYARGGFRFSTGYDHPNNGNQLKGVDYKMFIIGFFVVGLIVFLWLTSPPRHYLTKRDNALAARVDATLRK